MRKKKLLAVAMSVMCVAGLMTGCGSSESTSGTGTTSGETTEDSGSGSQPITVVSREDGSGTRGAFIELTGVQEKDADGNKIDHTISTAEITNSTSVMMTTIAGNEAAIGYISLGSLDNTVKAVKIDGTEASAENVKNG